MSGVNDGNNTPEIILETNESVIKAVSAESAKTDRAHKSLADGINNPSDVDATIAGSPLAIGLWFLIPGIIQGIALYFIAEWGQNSNSISSLAFAFFGFITPLAFYLTTRKGARIAASIFAIVLGLVTAGLFYLAHHTFGADEIAPFVLGVSLVANGLISYISVPFFRTIVERKQKPTHYSSLYEFGWNLPVVGLCVTIFTIAVWIVLFVWAGMFNIIGIKFFESLFFDEFTAWPITFGALAVGIGVVREREGVFLALRTILFSLLRILAPIFAVATVLFTISAFATGLDDLWSGWSATSMMVLAVAIGIVLINGVIGDDDLPRHPVLSSAVRFQSFVLPVLAAFALYGIYVRIGDYGFTVERLLAFLVVAVACAYAVSYLISALIPKSAGMIRQANIVLALVVVAAAVLVQTPLVNFYKMSADDQVARLLDGETKPTQFDAAYLQFNLGRAGQKALEDLKTKDVPEKETVLALIKKAQEATSVYGARQGNTQTVNIIGLLEAIEDGRIKTYGGAVPKDLLDAIIGGRWINLRCFNNDVECSIFEVEKDKLYIRMENTTSSYRQRNFVWLGKSADEWRQVGHNNYYGKQPLDMRKIEENLAAGNYQSTMVTMKAFQIGDTILIPNIERDDVRDVLIGTPSPKVILRNESDDQTPVQ